MRLFPGILLFIILDVCNAASATEIPATGRFLVASESLRGPFFAETVILLLQYDEAGAVGLVVNRPMNAALAEAMPDFSGLDEYTGSLYWGGPVDLNTIRALLRAESRPENAARIFDGVFMVPPDYAVTDDADDASKLRFFLGYAGWAAGQLDSELAEGSWHVVPASTEFVFTDNPANSWRKLVPPKIHRASTSDVPAQQSRRPLSVGSAAAE